MVMTPHGPAIIGGFGGGGQLVMTPHGLAMIGSGPSVPVCKNCHNHFSMEDMPDRYDSNPLAMSVEHASKHRSSCARVRAHEEAVADERRRERAAAARIAARSVSSMPSARHRAMLVKSSRRLLEKYHATPTKMSTATAASEEDRRRCKEVCDALVAKSPFPGLKFTGLLTNTPTGQAVVLSGRQDAKDVAIKVFLKRDAPDMAAEVRFLSLVSGHGNVMSLIAHHAEPWPAVVMPLAAKGSIADLLNSRGALAPVLVLQYGKQIANGLRHIHSRNVAHLDMKAMNVLLTAANVPVISDFGMSLDSTGRDRVPASGTASFMAPEAWADGATETDAKKADSWAFGCMLYEMLSGKVPHLDLNRGDLEAWHEAIRTAVCRPSPSPPYSALDKRWSGGLVRLMTSCWAFDHHARPDMGRVCGEMNALT